ARRVVVLHAQHVLSSPGLRHWGSVHRGAAGQTSPRPSSGCSPIAGSSDGAASRYERITTAARYAAYSRPPPMMATTVTTMIPKSRRSRIERRWPAAPVVLVGGRQKKPPPKPHGQCEETRGDNSNGDGVTHNSSVLSGQFRGRSGARGADAEGAPRRRVLLCMEPGSRPGAPVSLCSQAKGAFWRSSRCLTVTTGGTTWTRPVEIMPRP